MPTAINSSAGTGEPSTESALMAGDMPRRQLSTQNSMNDMSEADQAASGDFSDGPQDLDFGPNFKIIPVNDQIRELQTVIRDRVTSRSDFVFYADRLIRLVIEESLNHLPYTKCRVITPTGKPYDGVKYVTGNCGVSIVRSGEAMEKGLRDCYRSIRIGKILIQSEEDTHQARVVYAKFPEDIASRKVLLMYPIMSSGNTVTKAVRVLKEHGVQEKNIILLNLFCTPHAATVITKTFPDMFIVTSEVHKVAPNHFGQKYFGTESDRVY